MFINKIFISYSRQDLLKARRLYESLQLNKIDPFIDWEDIPLGADWQACIEGAIKQAFAFIFLVSKSSIQSDVCRWELNKALEHCPFVFPVVIDDIEVEECDDSLKKLNWVFLNNEEKYECEVARFIERIIQVSQFIEETDNRPKAKITIFCRLKSGQFYKEYFPLAKRCYSLGRNPEFSHQVSPILFNQDPTISRQHSVFFWLANASTYGIQDGSTSGDKSQFGTYVGCQSHKGNATGGKALPQGEIHPLKNLELVRVGKFTFFCFELIRQKEVTFDGEETLTSAEDAQAD